jgi:hypothetical protein
MLEFPCQDHFWALSQGGILVKIGFEGPGWGANFAARVGFSWLPEGSAADAMPQVAGVLAVLEFQSAEACRGRILGDNPVLHAVSLI